MFRIRKIHDDTNVNKASLAQVQAILRTQFQALDEADIAKLPQQLKSPHKHRFRAILFVAEDARAQVLGFALVFHDPELHFCYLDFLSAARGGTGGGTGGALYQRVREESRSLEAKGLFFECLPDDPELSPDDKIRAQNVARLKFYEHYDARPIANTAYETPLREGVTDPPYLVFDGLGGNRRCGVYTPARWYAPFSNASTARSVPRNISTRWSTLFATIRCNCARRGMKAKRPPGRRWVRRCALGPSR